MSQRPSYLGAAFNLRPLGMPIPPNWFMLAAFGLLGAFVHPAWWLIGAGAEIGYLGLLLSNARFRAAVDASSKPSARSGDRHAALLRELKAAERQVQQAIEKRCDDLIGLLRRLDADAFGEQAERLAQLCWLHLRLLVARQALNTVLAGREHGQLANQRANLEARLRQTDLDPAVRTSLEGQVAVLTDRARGHAEAATRLEVIEAEIERIRQQVELAREQALIATDANGLTRSVDVLASSLGEANRWLRDQRDLFSDIDPFADAPAPAMLFPTARPVSENSS